MTYPTQADFEAWLVAEPRPDAVVATARAVPPTTCYRLKSTGERGHYVVHSYSEKGTITFRHGADSHMPGIAVFGITPDDAVPCGCGNWKPPTAAQARATHSRIEAMHARLRDCHDPNCQIHRRGPKGRPS